VTVATAQIETADLLAALLRGEVVPWARFQMPWSEFLRACRDDCVTALVHEHVRALPPECDWPRDIREALAIEARAHAADELLQYRELTLVLEALAVDHLFPILLKGAALAYTVYETPSSRPRIDTDLLIRRGEVDAFRRVMANRGYTTPLNSGGELLFSQFQLLKTTPHGVVHRFDCHWKISTQSMFADVLTFDEMAGRAIQLPALGPHARTLAPIDALLLACVHPAMHHRNADLLLWAYDVHLLASTLSDHDFDRFAQLAVGKHVAAICAHQLGVARMRFGTEIPETATRMLARVQQREASAVYLRPNRRWIDEVISSVRGLPRAGDRIRLLREIAFPRPAYMLAAYGFTSSARHLAWLPLLYAHRIVFGCWKLVAGRK
jgi:hypothetical protein